MKLKPFKTLQRFADLFFGRPLLRLQTSELADDSTVLGEAFLPFLEACRSGLDFSFSESAEDNSETAATLPDVFFGRPLLRLPTSDLADDSTVPGEAFLPFLEVCRPGLGFSLSESAEDKPDAPNSLSLTSDSSLDSIHLKYIHINSEIA